MAKQYSHEELIVRKRKKAAKKEKMKQLYNSMKFSHAIYHVLPNRCLYRNHAREIELPNEIVQFIYGKALRWGVDHVEFTVGQDDEFCTVAVCHPKDSYVRKQGVNMVFNRIIQARAHPLYVKSKPWIVAKPQEQEE